MIAKYKIEEWDEAHPRRADFLTCLKTAAPEQLPFVTGDYYRAYPCYLFVALQAIEVAGFIRFAVQPIGPEANCPPLCLNGVQLTEAKIHAFAVREEARGRGIGTALQRKTIHRAKELGCYQIASYSSYGRDVNHHIKLSLGFAAQPERNGHNEMGVYFVMPLQNVEP